MNARVTLRLDDYLSKGSTDRANYPVREIVWNWRTERTMVEEIDVEGGNLFAEKDAIVDNSSGSRDNGNPRRTQRAPAEDRDDDDVVAVPVPGVGGNYQGRPGLMRVVRLAGGIDEPDLAAERRAGTHRDSPLRVSAINRRGLCLMPSRAF